MDPAYALATTRAASGLSATIIALCRRKYSLAAGTAQSDIDRLSRQLRDLNAWLQYTILLVEAPTGHIHPDLFDQISACEAELSRLRDNIESRSSGFRARFRARKWPLSNKETEETIKRLKQYHEHVVGASMTREPCAILPFPRNALFVDRHPIQELIEEHFAGSAHRLALVGPGGIGYDHRGIFLMRS